jgi:hypothetical protein
MLKQLKDFTFLLKSVQNYIDPNIVVEDENYSW